MAHCEKQEACLLQTPNKREVPNFQRYLLTKVAGRHRKIKLK